MKCFRAKKFVGGIRSDILDTFPTRKPNQSRLCCRQIKYHYNTNIYIHCAEENLAVHRIVQHLFKMYNSIHTKAPSWSHFCL